MSGSLYDAFQRQGIEPDRVFLEGQSGATLTYGDLAARSARYASAFAALGVKKGDRVAVQVEKSVEALLLYFGCLRAGAIYLPLNSAYTPAEIAYFLGDAEPRVFVCDSARREALAGAARDAWVAHLETLDATGHGSIRDTADAAPAEFTAPEISERDLAAILYTSGTTGRSKGAMLTHGNLVSNAEALVAIWGFTSADVLIHALPLYHTHGLFVAVGTVLLSGASMIFLSRFDADVVVALLPRATTMMGVPTFYTRLLAQPDFTRERAAHMRLFISGSAPLSVETHRAFQERTGHALLERYGMTETSMNTSNPLDGERRPGTVGFPLPGVEIRVADPASGRALPNGEVGVIEVRGPNVFQGYWRNPEKTREEFRDDGFFVTGDLAYLDPGGYVTISGRAKDLIITGGFNVYPAEVEAALDAVPGVAESAVIGLPHPDFGEGVTGVVALRDGSAPDEAAIRTALGGVLASFKVPKRVLFVDALPRNTMGKVQKNVLREANSGLYSNGAG